MVRVGVVYFLERESKEVTIHQASERPHTAEEHQHQLLPLQSSTHTQAYAATTSFLFYSTAFFLSLYFYRLVQKKENGNKG
jgi:hypothetical protein